MSSSASLKIAPSQTVLSRAPTQRQDPDVRRQDLLRVTISCLARLGPQGTTGREICRQAGVSHGLLRHYFNNPNDLLLETYEQLCEQFLDAMHQGIQPEVANPWSALDRYFAQLFSDEWAVPDVLGAWIAFWTLVRSRDDFARVSLSFNSRMLALLSAAASRLQSADKTMSHADTVAVLAAMLNGLWLDVCLRPSENRTERARVLCQVAARRLFTEQPDPST